MEKEKRKAFCNHIDNGFFLKFPNGNSLSTIWGRGTYSDNYDALSGPVEDYGKNIEASSDTVEVMPNCSETVKALLEAKFEEESTGSSVFACLTFSRWLEMVNILNKHV